MKRMRKKLFAVICCISILLGGCSQGTENFDDSYQQESIVDRNFTVYEQRVLNNAVTYDLDVACKTLYMCVYKGSITQTTVEGVLSFANKVPKANASPSEKREKAKKLTVGNAIEYFSLQNKYTKENIKDYGYLNVSYNDDDWIKGTVISIETVKDISVDYTAFSDMNTPLGDMLPLFF